MFVVERALYFRYLQCFAGRLRVLLPCCGGAVADTALSAPMCPIGKEGGQAKLIVHITQRGLKINKKIVFICK